MHQRKELEIKIPVCSGNVHEFTRPSSKNSHHFANVSREIFYFVNNTLINDFGFSHFARLDFKNLIELVKNSFDAYVAEGLVPGSFLILKITVERKNDVLLIKLKDNGCGFRGFNNGEYVLRQQIRCQDKTFEKGHLGHARLGLELFSNNMNHIDGQYAFRNRKHTKGASIHIKFPVTAKL